MKRLVLIRNLRAGMGGRDRLAPSIKSLVPAEARLFETASLEELKQTAKELPATSPDVIAFWGGDGTITTTLSALIEAYAWEDLPALCFLPGGTVNVIAKELGLGGDPRRALHGLLDDLRNDRLKVIERTAIRCKQRAGFLFGVGLIPNFHDEYNKSGTGGSRHAAFVLARAAFDAVAGGALAKKLFVPFGARIAIDGEPWVDGAWTNVSAGSIEGLGFGFRPYRRATERRGGFHVVAHALTARAALAEMPKVRFGKGMTAGEHTVASRAEIRLDRPLRWGFDGDTFEPSDHLILEGGLTVRLVLPSV